MTAQIPISKPMETAPRIGYVWLILDGKPVRRRWAKKQWKDMYNKPAGKDNLYSGWMPQGGC